MKSTATDKSIKSKNIKTRVIPGYHLTFGIVVAMLSVIVLIPLASVLVYSLKTSPAEFVGLILKENIRNRIEKFLDAANIAQLQKMADIMGISIK